MRNKYSKEFETEMVMLAPTTTLNELLGVAKAKYKYTITKKQLQLTDKWIKKFLLIKQ